jgi:hypothetical protein
MTQGTKGLWEENGQSLSYEVHGKEVCIVGQAANSAELIIPNRIEEYPVIAIEKKAFLSRKQLKKVILSGTVRSVGDWAFAHCDKLEVIQIPHRNVELGKAVFLECGRLRSIRVADADEDTSVLLAAAVVQADAPYLLNLMEAGSDEWLAKWDARMLTILDSDDMDGYSKQILCGEEDYGSTDVTAFVHGKRMQKVRLLYTRLLHASGLEDNIREQLETYLREHTLGGVSDETWQVLLKEHPDDSEYHNLFAKLGCINEKNFEELLSRAGEEHPALRAFLLRHKSENMEKTDFFADLDL